MSYNIRVIGLTLAAGTASFLLTRYLISKFSKKVTKKCIVIESVEDWNKYESEIVKIFCKSVVGLDCEWVTEGNKRSPVSLLQLANDSGFCVLLRLCCMPDCLIPVGLSDLLNDQNILKVGVGVYDDVDKLFQDYSLVVRGFIDLRYLVQDLREMQDKNLGLKSIGKELLGMELNKSRSLRCSEWNACKLTIDQIRYAANDAIISAQIYAEAKRRKSSWFSISNFLEESNVYMDIPYKQALNNHKDKMCSLTVHQKSHKTRYSKPRQKPMYDNCQLVAPDGELLCSCDRGKADWYVYKGLGEVICDEPFTIRLNFEPSGRPILDNIFYTKEKFNCCVVCGKTENHYRKLVVPSEYRKYFPDIMKKNLSHDVLLLCVDCHRRSNILDQKMRVKLAVKCDAPLGCHKNGKYKTNSVLARVRSTANALCKSGEKIPETRKKQLEKIIMDYYKVDSITEEILDEACNTDVNIRNDSYISHGQKVYYHFCKNSGLIQLEKFWRQHFLDSMQPKYLPDMWSVEHNHKRLALQVMNNQRQIDFDVSILGLSPDLLEEVELEFANKESETNHYKQESNFVDDELSTN